MKHRPNVSRAALLTWVGLIAVWSGSLHYSVQAARRGQDAKPRPSSNGVSSRPPSTPVSQSAAARAVLDQYCVTCHNQRLKTAGLALDKLDLEHVGDSAEVWEKVARKLRTREMPPPGRPRPDPDDLRRRCASWLENSARRRGGGQPNPGRVAVHRLNRTEYANADSRPAGLEVDARSLLIGGRTGSPELRQHRQRPVGVAGTARELSHRQPRKVSRLAVGDPTHQPGGRNLQRAHRVGAGRAHQRRPAVRVAGRDVDPPPLSARRRVQHQGSAAAPALSLHHRNGRAAPARRPPGRRARQAVHGWRRRQGHDDARELCGQYAGRSRVGSVHAHGGRRPRGSRPGQGRHARGGRVVRQKLLGT